MKGNGNLDDRAPAPSFTTFHPHPLHPFAAAARGDVVGQKRAAPDHGAFGGGGGGGSQDGYHNGAAGNTTTATEAAASSSPPAAPSPTSSTPGSKRPRKAPVAAETAAGGDGATIEVARRPRGRPPGSKNKPKQPLALGAAASGALAVAPTDAATGSGEHAGGGAAAMRPHILEVPAGHDIAESLAAFSRRRDIGVSALTATGPVSNVTLRQPQMVSSSPASVVTLHGRLDLLSISATFFPPSFGAASPLLPAAAAGTVSVSLAGPHGQIVGGAVAGPLVAAGTVTVIAATFGCPSYHRLPLDDDLSFSVSVSPPAGDTSSGGGGPTGRPAPAGDFHVDQSPPAAAHPRHEYAHHHSHPQQQPPQQQQHHNNHQPTAQPEPPVTSLPISTSHLLSDVIWAPRDVRRRPF